MNWELIGHEWAVELLQEHVTRGRVRHAYLFTGPQGVGKRTLALRFAQTLNCTASEIQREPCQECSACQRISKMAHPDLHIVQAEQVGGTLKVDQIRELQHSLSLSPYESRYRVALLLRFEEAHPSASNALLKTLEEPNPQVILILTAENSETLLPTIVSRCEVLRLRTIPVLDIQNGLQNLFQIPTDEAQTLAHLSDGRPGVAVFLHQDSDELDRRRKRIDDLFSLFPASRLDRFAYAESLSKDREEIRPTLLTWISFWRDLLLLTAGTQAPITNLEWSKEITGLAGRLDRQLTWRLLNRLEYSLQLIDRNVNARLALEVLMLDLPTLPA